MSKDLEQLKQEWVRINQEKSLLEEQKTKLDASIKQLEYAELREFTNRLNALLEEFPEVKLMSLRGEYEQTARLGFYKNSYTDCGYDPIVTWTEHRITLK